MGDLESARVVPRIINTSRDLVLNEALIAMLNYLGPKHPAVVAVEELKDDKAKQAL